MSKRLYTVLMWLAKLLFLFAIGYAATDITTQLDDSTDSRTPAVKHDTAADLQGNPSNSANSQ